MAEILLTSANAILPIVCLIILGYLLKICHFFSENFVKIGNALVFKILLPCKLFINIYDSMDSFSDIRWDVIIYACVIILLIAGLGLITAIKATDVRNRRGVILQCSFRSNFVIIGLSLIERMGGDMGVAGIVSAFSMPLFNVLVVIALSIYADDSGQEKKVKRNSVRGILLGIITNPIIIGVLLGFVCIAIREIERVAFGYTPFRLDTQLKFVYSVISDLKGATTPIALLILGAQFEFSAVKGMTKEITIGVVWRLIIAPLIGIGLAILLSTYTNILSFDYTVYPTFVALFGGPVAVSSAIMAGQMNNDKQLAVQYVVWTTIFSLFTIFILTSTLMYYGYIQI